MVRKYTIVNNKLRFVLLVIILFFGVLQGYSQCPTADADGDQSICSTINSILLEGVATDYDSIAWETYGTGTFDDATLLQPVYTPSAADITGGSLLIVMRVYGDTATCPSGPNPATDQLTLSIIPPPTADAGDDQTICETDNVSLLATVTYEASVVWSNNGGDGTFSSTTAYNPTYYPGPNDISNSSLLITLTAVGNSPCTNATNELIVTINQSPEANAGSDASVCEGSTYTLDGTPTNETSILWSNGTGDGTFSSTTAEDPIYTPGTADIAAGTVTLTMTAYGQSPCADDTDAMTLTIVASPTTSAGDDQTICESTTVVALAGSSVNTASELWEIVSGDGTFEDATSPTSNYNLGPGDVSGTTVILKLTGTANSPCSDVSDQMSITINPEATVNAGPATGTICGSNPFSLSSATASNYLSLLWETDGDGTFNGGENTQNPDYTSGPNDIIDGIVNLTFKAYNQTPCTGFNSDFLTLTVNTAPIVSAGLNGSTCDTSVYTLSGTSSNSSQDTWTTLGDGSFNGTEHNLNAEYTPGTNDIAAGTVTLTLTASPVSPCTTSEDDSMILTIISDPTVYAGADETICEGSNLDITDATASSSVVLAWITDGDGSFTSTTSLVTTYIPGTTDINTGTVNLELTATSTGACSGSVSDTRILTIKNNPTANAGSDETICNTETLTISTATAVDYLDLLWTTSGTGNFTSENTLNPTYTPSAGDISAGSVTLTLTASAQNPCSSSSSDNMLLTIHLHP